jgi:hypothetical protein
MPEANGHPYSSQYSTINHIGHARPTPSFGAPTLIWHLGIWPKRNADPQDVSGPTRSEARERFEEKQIQWVDQINALLRRIQEGHRRSGRTERFILRRPAHEEFNNEEFNGDDPDDKAFMVFEQESLHFTIWWPDPEDPSRRGALRVRVHAHMHQDYLTLSFYVDITKPWQESARFDSATASGPLRKKLMSCAENVRAICERRRADPSAIDVDLVPETGVSGPDAKQLLAAADLLYDGAWQQFCREFGVDLATLAGKDGEIFANFRGLVLAAASSPAFDLFDDDGDGDGDGEDGGKDTADVARSQALAAPGTELFEVFDDHSAEPNAVLKAYWPFIRRSTPYADYREYIACGVMGWRALYVTAFGAEFTTDYQDETASRSDDVPAGALPAGEEGALTRARKVAERASAADTAASPDPVRYLILTKGPPHRKQIGRVVGRVNAMGTMRLIALKDWSIIRDADAHIRMQGQELDRVTMQWSLDRDIIEDDAPARPNFIRRLIRAGNGEAADEKKYERISDLTKRVEAKLIKIAATLDKIGVGAIGGLPYRISRSTYYVRECSVLIDTLQIGHIHSWNSYNSFVKLGLQPAFDYITEAGERLRRLRVRLQSVTGAIQTSALVAQITATHANTKALNALARRHTRGNLMIGTLNFLLLLIAFFMGVSVTKPGAGDMFKRATEQLGQIGVQVGDVFRHIAASLGLGG